MRFPDPYQALLKISHQVFFTLLIVSNLLSVTAQQGAKNDSENVISEKLELAARGVATILMEEVANQVSASGDGTMTLLDVIGGMGLSTDSWQQVPFAVKDGEQLPLEYRFTTSSSSYNAGFGTDRELNQTLLLSIRVDSEKTNAGFESGILEFEQKFAVNW